MEFERIVPLHSALEAQTHFPESGSAHLEEWAEFSVVFWARLSCGVCGRRYMSCCSFHKPSIALAKFLLIVCKRNSRLMAIPVTGVIIDGTVSVGSIVAQRKISSSKLLDCKDSARDGRHDALVSTSVISRSQLSRQALHSSPYSFRSGEACRNNEPARSKRTRGVLTKRCFK